MKSAAERQLNATVAVPRPDHDSAAEAGDGDCVVEGVRVAGQLVGKVHSLGFVQPASYLISSNIELFQ